MKVKIKGDFKGVVRRLEGIRVRAVTVGEELCLECAKRAVSRALRTTPPQGLGGKGDDGKGRRRLKERIAENLGGDPQSPADVRMKRTESGELRPYAYPGKRSGGVLFGLRGSVKGVRLVSAAQFVGSSTRGKAFKRSVWRKLRGGQRQGYVKMADLRRFIREKQGRIGRLAAGWMAGVVRCGLKKVPKWISGQSGVKRGRAVLARRGGRFTFLASNGEAGGYEDKEHFGRVVRFAVENAYKAMKPVMKGFMRKIVRDGGRK